MKHAVSDSKWYEASPSTHHVCVCVCERERERERERALSVRAFARKCVCLRVHRMRVSVCDWVCIGTVRAKGSCTGSDEQSSVCTNLSVPEQTCRV